MPTMVGLAPHWSDVVDKGTSNPFSTAMTNEAPSPTSVSVVPTGVAGKEADESPTNRDLIKNPKVVESASRFQWSEEDSTNLVARGGANDDNDERFGTSEPPGCELNSDLLSKPEKFVASPSLATQQTTVTGNISTQSQKREKSPSENRYRRLLLCGAELPEEIRGSLQDVNATMRQIASLKFGPEEKEAVRDTLKEAKNYTIEKVRSALTRHPKVDIIEEEEEEEDGDLWDELNEGKRKTMKPISPRPERPRSRMLV